jgi:hypothetical protein
MSFETLEVNLKVEIMCVECHEPLSTLQTTIANEKVIMVTPCETCLTAAREEELAKARRFS